MPAGRPQSLVASCDQWLRATHDGTAVMGPDAELMLSWNEPGAPSEEEPAGVGPCLARGLGVDRLCRLYRLGSDLLERIALGATASGIDYSLLGEPTVVIAAPTAPPSPGPDFEPVPVAALEDAVGLAVDGDDRLFLADRATRSISVLDLWSRRLLRQVVVATLSHPERHPMGLAARDGVVLAAVRAPSGLLRLTASRGPEELPLPDAVADLPPDAEPARVSVLRGGVPVVLFQDPTGASWLVSGRRPARAVGRASDIAVDATGAVVVAPCPGDPGAGMLRRLAPTAAGWNREEPLDAAGYDGRGIVATADGRIAYSTAAGIRLAVRARVDYLLEGTCTTYRLDSGTPRNRWGRLTIEACIPDGTECLVATVSADDEFATEAAHALPDPRPDCPTPVASTLAPLPPPFLALESAMRLGGLHERGGPLTPWWPSDGGATTFEAPVVAPPGRYLWVTLRLRGNRRRTPRVREIRVERTAHTLMRRLPAVYSADERQADFLHRYLATFDGIMHDLDVRSRCREILVDPSGTPAEALDWLASFLGLVLDDRWHEAGRRRLVAEIVELFRRRGTLGALERYVAIYLAGARAAGDDDQWVRPVIVEHFRLRGVGGPILGGDATTSSRSVLGAGFRVGGTVGELGTRPLDPDATEGTAYASHAHRFSVLVPMPLDAEQDAVVRRILDVERPAHTAYELCTVDAGMRVGRGLHLGLSSLVGPTGTFEAAIADRTLLGRGGILGGPSTGVAVEASRVGTTARVG